MLGPQPNQHNLVARLRRQRLRATRPAARAPRRGRGPREDWSVDPFAFLEKDGYFYGRGTTDDKAQAAIWIATLIRLKQEGVVPIAI